MGQRVSRKIESLNSDLCYPRSPNRDLGTHLRAEARDCLAARAREVRTIGPGEVYCLTPEAAAKPAV
jgi:hypothetical protein